MILINNMDVINTEYKLLNCFWNFTTKNITSKIHAINHVSYMKLTGDLKSKLVRGIGSEKVNGLIEEWVGSIYL